MFYKNLQITLWEKSAKKNGPDQKGKYQNNGEKMPVKIGQWGLAKGQTKQRPQYKGEKTSPQG